jgi:hypothetical protein
VRPQLDNIIPARLAQERRGIKMHTRNAIITPSSSKNIGFFWIWKK